MHNKILVVDDSASLRKMLNAFLTEAGYSVETAENGEVAFEILKSENISVVLTDLEMPVMDGSALIDNISTLKDQPVIIVLTSHDDSELIVNMMKKGISDYLIKPLKKNDLLIRIQNAFKVSELNRIKMISEKEKVIRLEHQLEWYKLIERMGKKETKMKKSDLFENLKRSLNQGSGIGIMISLADLITYTAQKKDSVYEVDEKIIDLIAENKKLVYKTMEVISDIEKVSSEKIELKEMYLNELYDLINKSIKELEKFTKVRKHSVLLSESKIAFNKIKVNINTDFFKKVIDELLINAMKYSRDSSVIMVLLDFKVEDITFSVVNSTKSENDEGIPVEYENIVFEPFFRKIKYIQEEYNTLDYGLGLSLVAGIAQKHNGKVVIHNIKDYSDFRKNPETKIMCEVTIPRAG